MSGSPVLAYSATGTFSNTQGALLMSAHGAGPCARFVGIYSGRLGEDEMKAQLGIVWKAHVVDEIIDGGVHEASE